MAIPESQREEEVDNLPLRTKVNSMRVLWYAIHPTINSQRPFQS